MASLRRNVSMQQIADKLNISKNAVSLALNGRAGVSDEMREKIFAMAETMGYGGLSKSKEKDNKILVIIPEYIRYDSYFYNAIYWSIEISSKLNGYTSILSTVSDEMQNTKSMPSLYYEMKFIGIITVGVIKPDYLEHLKKISNNIVSVDNNNYGLNLDYVLTANIDGAYSITKFLIDLGHTKIGFIGSILETSSLFERWCGYINALSEADIDIIKCKEFSITEHSPLDVLLSDSEDMRQKLLAMKHLPTAFVCGGDRIAISVINALKNINVNVPKDVSVVGFDNIEAATFLSPQLTTMNVKRKKMGEMAVDICISNANKNGKLDPIKRMLPTDLIIRDSTAIPRLTDLDV